MGEHQLVTEHKNPIEQALDVFVFAPLGFVLSARQTIPELAKKGREYAAAAKVMGEFAIGQGREQAEKAVRQAGDQATQTLSVVQSLSGRQPSRPAPPTRPAAPEPPDATEAPAPPAAPEGAAVRAEAGPESGGNGATAVRPTAQNLAIPGYDTLSASQVVQRLGGLSAEELEAVRAYEESGRGRKTILARVEQLQSGS